MPTPSVDKSGKGILIDAINRGIAQVDPTLVLTANDIELGAVEVSSNEERESQVTFAAKAGTDFEGEATVFFDRRDLTELFASAGIEVVQVPEGPTTTAEVVAALNLRYGAGFTADDIVMNTDAVIEGNEVTLSAEPTSHGFKGEVLVLIEAGEPVEEELPVYIVAPVVVSGDIGVKGQKEDGTMLNGTGNPVGEMTVASNGEIELALGARVWKSGDLPVAQDGHYDIVIDDVGGDWNWPFSISLLQEERPVTDLYAVVLTAQSVETGVSVPFTLSRDAEGVYHFINEEFTLDISDSVQSLSGDVLQNIQRMTFYKAQLGAMTTNTFGSPIGDFIINMTATRLVGEVPAVVCEISANVTVPAPQ